MSSLRGILTGSLGLVMLYNVETTKNPGGVSTLAGLPGRVANWLISPNVPLIPDLRSSSSSSSGLVGTIDPTTGHKIIAEGTVPNNSLGSQLSQLSSGAGGLAALAAL